VSKFHFNLETLLRYREGIEQNARDELMRRIYEQQVELKKREDIQTRLQTTISELTEKQAENYECHEMSIYQTYLKRLAQEICECENRMDKLRLEMDAQKVVFIDASKKRKILSSMKNKKEKAFNIERERSWQKEIDDLVILRYAYEDDEQG